MSPFSSDLYNERQIGVDTMGWRSFMMAISGFTAVLIVIGMIGASFSYNWAFTNSYLYILFLLVCLVVAVVGGSWAHSTDEPMFSFIGGGICAGAMGLMIGPFIALFETGSVVQAFLLASGVVLITGVIGALLPQDLSSWGAPLFGLLLGAIVIQFGGIIMSMFGVEMQLVFTLLDWAVLILFCGIMVYDLNMAQRLDKTLDNAIDVAVSVFMNFANIFIRILSIMGQRRS